ncbi:MAG: alpha/beta hydrolase [Methylococcaceae bacterium]|nr:alpha/beta hydrolase [Methylococcaceae bacterium]
MKYFSLVLLPGLDGTGRLFKPLLDVLPSNIRPIVVNYPLDKLLSYNELLPIVLESLPADKPFIVLGESFSGPLALMVAATRPLNLEGLVLCATFVACPLSFVPRGAKALIEPFLFQGLKKLAKINAYKGTRLALEMNQAISSVKNEVLAKRVQEIIGVDVTQELVDSHLPILYLQGKKDLIVRKSNLRRILELRPDAQFVCINSSHLLVQTEPLQAVEAINKFILNLERRPK